MFTRRLAALLAVLALLVTACAPNQTPEPSTEPAPSTDASKAPGPIAEATSTPQPSELPPVEAPPSSVDLIKADVESGKLDEATGYQYRFYAQYWDPRLPEPYQGESEPDHELADLAAFAYPAMSAADQEKIRPFLLRPTDPASYYQDPAAFAGGAGSGGGVSGRAPRSIAAPAAIRGGILGATTDPLCAPYGLHREDVPFLPATVWGVCDEVNGDLTYTAAAKERVRKTVTFIGDLWLPMTGLMGWPIPDEFSNAGGRGEVEEAGDGRLDIYVVVSIGTGYPRSRSLGVQGLGVTHAAAPIDGSDPSSPSSAYVVVNWPKSGPSDARRKGNVAHEFFHVLQNKHNARGKLACAYPNVAGPCQSKESHWIADATAAWAEHHYVPEDDGRQPDYDRFHYFLTTDQPLSATADDNAYRSWLWPLFMEQETNSEAIIGTLWRNLEGKSGWDAFQQTVNATYPFADHFHDFAVRVWNEKMAGDPFKRFEALDAKFPPTLPNDEVAIQLFLLSHGFTEAELQAMDVIKRFGEVIQLPLTRNTVTVTEPGIPELWAEYYDISPDSQVRALDFVFSGLTPQSQLDVDMLLRIDDKWERRSYGGGTIQFCMDKPEDAIQQIILVLSNHEHRPKKPIRGSWTVSPSATGCLTASDSLTYTSVYEKGQPGDDTYWIAKETLTIQVKLEVDSGGGPTSIPLKNKASTYQASYEYHLIVDGGDICDYVTDSAGGGGGIFSGDELTGGLARLPSGEWEMVVSGGAEIPIQGSQGNCAMMEPITNVARILLPECVGTEIVGSSPRAFDFNCSHTGEWTWSVRGKLVANF